MSRVSQEELYNDKDVVTQILKLKDTVNDYAGGIIENIDVSGNNLVIDWADGTNISLPLPNPTGISSIAGSISGTNLTITIYMTDGSSHAFTTPLNGIATENYVDTKDLQVQDWAENVAYEDDTVNNLLHKEGNETVKGVKSIETIKDCNLNIYVFNPNDATISYYKAVRLIKNDSSYRHYFMKVRSSNYRNLEWDIHIEVLASVDAKITAECYGTSAADTDLSNIKLVLDGDYWLLLIKKATNNIIYDITEIQSMDAYGVPQPIADLVFYYNEIDDPANYGTVKTAVAAYSYHNGVSI
jgi:hypothetical protein